jgi:hypothetical protein
MARRNPRDWPDFMSVTLLPVTGFRDQRLRITYLPWSDAVLGLVGWEVIPDRSTRATPVLVYVVPSTDNGTLEIRCHIATDEPDPTTDQLLGKVTIPPELLGIKGD